MLTNKKIAGLSLDALYKELKNSRLMYFKTRMAVVSGDKKTHQVSLHKKYIAKILTFIKLAKQSGEQK